MTGEQVEIIHPGEYNRDGGPDFINARLRIDGTLWAGNVEIHIRASDWFRHGHQDDAAYHNVILHVVDNYDREILDKENQTIPCVELKECYPVNLVETYEALLSGKQWIPCQNMLQEIDPSLFRLWAPALAIERLSRRAGSAGTWLSHSENRWDEVAFQLIASAMGNKINAQPFELLARATPLRILQRHRDQVTVIEALLFGQAGFLDPSFPGSYPAELLEMYRFYTAKYSLKPLEKGIWKFLRLRPVNFPAIRISQLAAIIHQRGGFQDCLRENFSIQDWMEMLQVSASVYWDTHYTFERESASRVKRVGADAVYLLLINGIAPLLYLYGSEKNQTQHLERTISLLEEIPPESNRIIASWTQFDMPAENALHTQALKQLKDSYCDKKRCLECRIGAKLFE